MGWSNSQPLEGKKTFSVKSEAYLEDREQIMPRDGVYVGRWGGYEAEALIKGTRYKFTTVLGIRSPLTECRITIRDGKASVEDS